MILIIDNYDSFVHNLARYIRELGHETEVIRNDKRSVRECMALKPEGVVISPGPKRPEDAGISLDLLQTIPASTPFLGVCLGHQCLVEMFGGKTRRAQYPLHGEASLIRHSKTGIFENIPSPMYAGRYHSLISELQEASPLDATAWSREGELMAVAHRERPWFGVQFHPESLLTEHGHALVKNFLNYCNGRLSDDLLD
jgi:para-aminobenzoate synthetase component 2